MCELVEHGHRYDALLPKESPGPTTAYPQLAPPRFARSCAISMTAEPT
jgi:hypothetical protein